MNNNRNNRDGYEASIPGVSDVDIMPRRGFIRLGESMEERKDKGLNYPKELYHLGRVDGSDEDIKLYHSLYGKEPQAIKIVFVSNLPTENFPQEFVSWNSKGQKKCYGNGQMGFEREIAISEQAAKRLKSAKDEQEREFLEKRLSPDDYDYSEKPIACQGFDCPKYRDNKCQLEGTLKFLIVGMDGLRLWWIRTGSKWTMKTVRTMHELIRSLNSPSGDPDFGRMRGIPLLLTREKKQYTLPSGVKTTKWVLSLDAADVGISDLLSMAEPAAIAERAKKAVALLRGPENEVDQAPEERKEAEQTVESEDKEPEYDDSTMGRGEPVEQPEETSQEEPEFDPSSRKKDFLGLDKTAQIEVLEGLTKRKAYDKKNLKKPLDEFDQQQREMFWDSLYREKDADPQRIDDDIPF